MQLKRARFLDNIFYCFSTICLTVILLGYLFTSFITQLIIGTTLGIIIYFLIFQKTSLVNKINYEKRIKEKHKQDCINCFSTATIEKTNYFFVKLFETNFNCKIIDNYLLFTNKQSTNNKFKIYYNFYTTEITPADIMPILTKKNNTMPILFISKAFNLNSIELSKTYKQLILIDSEEFYKILEKYNTFPKINETPKENKFKKFLSGIISYTNAKPFIKGSLVLIGFSFFSKYKLIYRIFAGLFFVLSVLCIYKKERPTVKEERLSFIFKN